MVKARADSSSLEEQKPSTAVFFTKVIDQRAIAPDAFVRIIEGKRGKAGVLGDENVVKFVEDRSSQAVVCLICIE